MLRQIQNKFYNNCTSKFDFPGARQSFEKKTAKICTFYVVGRNLEKFTSQHKNFKKLNTTHYSACIDVFKKYFILTVNESIV